MSSSRGLRSAFMVVLARFLLIAVSGEHSEENLNCPRNVHHSDGPYFDVSVNQVTEGGNLPFPAAHMKSFKDFRSVFAPYNRLPSYYDYSTQCSKFHKQPPAITEEDIAAAYESASLRTFEQESTVQMARALSGSVNSSEAVEQFERQAMFLEFASKYLQEQKCLSKTSVNVFLPTLKLEKFETYPPPRYGDLSCDYAGSAYGQRRVPTCGRHFRYRSFDGSCNNLDKPLVGMSNTCARRLLPPDFADGISEFRVAANGSPLPNPRVLSTELLGKEDERPFDDRFNQLQVSFGQFVLEVINTVRSAGNLLSCCQKGRLAKVNHPQCAAIPIPPHDILAEQFNQTCMSFIRAAACPHCSLGFRQTINSQTPFIDLSNIYSSNRTLAATMRTFVNGTLVATLDSQGQEIFVSQRMPNPDPSELKFCNPTLHDVPCFKNADRVRGNGSPGHASWGMIFLRRHNQHARGLKAVNSHWSDERVFQEARALNIAEFARITYDEYLRTIIGKSLMNYFDLLSRTDDSYSHYQPDVSAQIISEFITAAGRFGHAQQHEFFDIVQPKTDHRPSFRLTLEQLFFNVTLYQDGYLTGLIQGQAIHPAYRMTGSIPLKNNLFHVPSATSRFDLGALDIQRQRDAGLPGYIYYVKYCYNMDIKSWSDLTKLIPCESVAKLQEHYKEVQDIELYVGGLHERPIPDATVGPTFACIIGIQYHNLKFGDRFYYEHGGQSGTLDLKRLNHIRERSRLATTLCRTTGLDNVQERPFELTSKQNPQVHCRSLPDINYSLWEER